MLTTRHQETLKFWWKLSSIADPEEPDEGPFDTSRDRQEGGGWRGPCIATIALNLTATYRVFEGICIPRG
jgi:hypothetical protein